MKKKTLSQMIEKADKVFSVYIRTKYAIDGIGTCVTCGVKKPWKELQNAHYIPRTHKSTRYDEKNCHPCCMPCNVFKKGAMDEYALFLKRTYGEGILEELGRKKRETKRYTIKELEDLITYWSQTGL